MSILFIVRVNILFLVNWSYDYVKKLTYDYVKMQQNLPSVCHMWQMFRNNP